MANAYTSWIIDASVERAWALVRDFNALPDWNPGIAESFMEQGLASDVVGAVRNLRLANGASGRERLLALDDRTYEVIYNFELAPLPLDNYIGRINLKPLNDGRTLAIWHSSYDERPENPTPFKRILESDVFAEGFRSLSTKLTNQPSTRQAAQPKQRLPGKVYFTACIDALLADVWPVLRASAGLGPWYAAPQESIAISTRSGRVGEERKLMVNGNLAREILTGLSDHSHQVRYSVHHENAAWQDYDAEVELHPITMNETTLVLWTIDWPNVEGGPDVAMHQAALNQAIAALCAPIARTHRKE